MKQVHLVKYQKLVPKRHLSKPKVKRVTPSLKKQKETAMLRKKSPLVMMGPTEWVTAMVQKPMSEETMSTMVLRKKST